MARISLGTAVRLALVAPALIVANSAQAGVGDLLVAPTRVVLRIVPATPTYLCVDRGLGTPVVFENTVADPQRFRGKRLRINLGKRDVQVWMNGKRVEVTPGPDPVGFAFTPRRARELPNGQRPCA